MIRIERWKNGRHWAVLMDGNLVCVCLYRKGAVEVKRRLGSGEKRTAGVS